MKKTTAISIRVGEDELEKIKLAAHLARYSSYSEFIRRTVILEAEKVIETNDAENKGNNT